MWRCHDAELGTCGGSAIDQRRTSWKVVSWERADTEKEEEQWPGRVKYTRVVHIEKAIT